MKVVDDERHQPGRTEHNAHGADDKCFAAPKRRFAAVRLRTPTRALKKLKDAALWSDKTGALAPISLLGRPWYWGAAAGPLSGPEYDVHR
jgi:hypothetical protein